MLSKRPFQLAAFGLALLAIPTHLGAAIRVFAITHSTNFAVGLSAAGSLASVFCTGLTGIRGVIRAQGSPLPMRLAGVNVYLDERSTPILAIADLGGYQQINFQVPWESNGRSSML